MMLKSLIRFVALVVVMGSCMPRQAVVLRQVDVLQIAPGKDGKPVLKANAVFYNPNSNRMKLKGVQIDISVDSVKSASVSQKLNTVIKPNAEFTVPLEVQLHIGERGLVDTILGMIGGKKHEVLFDGKLKVRVGLLPVKVPIRHVETIKF